jgi:hypothetical protein
LQSAGTTAVTIDTSQNVGIGNTSPAVPLHIGSGSATPTIRFGATSNGYDIGRNNSSGYFIQNATQASPYNQFIWQQSGTESVRVNTYGIGLGGTNPASGMGIAFPATQSASSDANTLDDYEEGTWTPAYGSAFTGTYASNGQVGFYTKVGRLVTAYFWIQVSTVSGSGLLSIQGFPFSSLSSVNYSAGVVIHLASSWGTNTPFSIDGGGTAYNIKYRASSNGSIDAGNINVSDLATNAFMRATLIYFT